MCKKGQNGQFVVTCSTNLSKKIHAKDLKIFFKKIFLKKKLVFGVRKKGFFEGGGEIPRKKCLDHKKKRHQVELAGCGC